MLQKDPLEQILLSQTTTIGDYTMNTYKMSQINEPPKEYALGVWWPDPPTPTQHILECIVDDPTQDVYYYNDNETTIKATSPIETTYPFTKENLSPHKLYFQYCQHKTEY